MRTRIHLEFEIVVAVHPHTEHFVGGRAADPFFAGLVVIAGEFYPIPFRTRPSKPPAPMVLRPKPRESRSLPGQPRTDKSGPAFTYTCLYPVKGIDYATIHMRTNMSAKISGAISTLPSGGFVPEWIELPKLSNEALAGVAQRISDRRYKLLQMKIVDLGREPTFSSQAIVHARATSDEFYCLYLFHELMHIDQANWSESFERLRSDLAISLSKSQKIVEYLKQTLVDDATRSVLILDSDFRASRQEMGEVTKIVPASTVLPAHLIRPKSVYRRRMERPLEQELEQNIVAGVLGSLLKQLNRRLDASLDKLETTLKRVDKLAAGASPSVAF